MAIAVFEFGNFKLDCGRFELCRYGRSIKLERKPMELLILLASKDGQLVTRTEIAEHLWDREVFVDTEHGINTAIRKIRYVLGDDPEQPCFVQTVTGKGYRFIGPIVEIRSLPAEEENQISSAQNDNLGISEAIATQAPSGSLPIPIQAANGTEQPDERKAARSGNSHLKVWLSLGFILALILVGIGLGVRSRFLGRAAKPEIKSLAVLPLDNLSGDSGQDYLADGMTDELTTMLAKNSTLRVISRTSVMQYKGAHRPLPEIARELGVDSILEGSVARSGDKVHMTIQLIYAPSDAHLWAESYDRDAADVAAFPTEAAKTIAKQLNRSVSSTAPARYVRPEAHDAYLHGRYLWFADKNDEAGKYFRKATELQPDYAPGWSGLSMYYGAGILDSLLNPTEALPLQEAAAIKAVQLDDSLPEAHLVMCAAIFLYRWDWAGADRECGRAIELDPKYAEAYHFRAKLLAALNRNQEAIESQKKAMELDPFSRPFALAYSFELARQYDAALNDALQRLESSPNDVSLNFMVYDIYRCKGMDKDAEPFFEKGLLLVGYKDAAVSVRRAFQQGGHKAMLAWQVNSLEKKARTQYVSPVELSSWYAQLGRREKTLDLLEEGYREHSPLLLWIQNDPAYDFLHTDERYRSIVQRVGLPPAY